MRVVTWFDWCKVEILSWSSDSVCFSGWFRCIVIGEYKSLSLVDDGVEVVSTGHVVEVACVLGRDFEVSNFEVIADHSWSKMSLCCCHSVDMFSSVCVDNVSGFLGCSHETCNNVP